MNIRKNSVSFGEMAWDNCNSVQRGIQGLFEQGSIFRISNPNAYSIARDQEKIYFIIAGE